MARTLSTKSKKRFARQIRAFLTRLNYRKEHVEKTVVDFYKGNEETKEPSEIVINFPNLIEERIIRKAIRHTSMGKKIVGHFQGSGVLLASMIRDTSFSLKRGYKV
jgi:hypothetical protein